MDTLSEVLPFLTLGALGVANLVAAIGALRDARRAEELREGASSYCAIITTGSSCCARSAGNC